MIKQMKMNNPKKAAGYTLAELLIAGGLLAIAILGGVAGYAASIEDGKLDQVSDDVAFIASKMQKCSLPYNGNYTNCTYKKLRENGMLDSSWGTGVGRSPFSGDYDAKVVTGNTNRFNVTSSGLPQDEYCVQLQQKWSTKSVVAPTCSSGTFSVTLGTR